ncbi:uncharacterized protein LOC131430424 [Malaya genurostris]|uniref:uncharacterized protein LOC131430424 n=1 Tax=Malaya genurostris TaxID=325434 RepID=UPI0026F3C00E|nr:uncharacterized protein LOC131430424 [Malaya genurostris]
MGNVRKLLPLLFISALVPIDSEGSSNGAYYYGNPYVQASGWSSQPKNGADPRTVENNQWNNYQQIGLRNTYPRPNSISDRSKFARDYYDWRNNMPDPAQMGRSYDYYQPFWGGGYPMRQPPIGYPTGYRSYSSWYGRRSGPPDYYNYPYYDPRMAWDDCCPRRRTNSRRDDYSYWDKANYDDVTTTMKPVSTTIRPTTRKPKLFVPNVWG